MSCLSNASATFIQGCKENQRQTCSINVITRAGTSFNFNESHIVSGGLVVDKYITTTKKLSYGNAIASELLLTLNNSDNYFNSFGDLNGATFSITIYCNGASIKLPKYIIDTVDKTKEIISLKGLDYMILLDKEISSSNFFIYSGTQLCNMIQLLNKISDISDVDWTLVLPINGNYTPTSNIYEKGMTYRQVVQYICEICGSNAFIDWNNKLRFEKLNNGSSTIIDLSDRFESNIAEEDVEINGISLTNNGVTTNYPVNSKYTISFVDNKLFQDTSLLQNIYLYNLGNNYSYRPYEMTIKSAPYLYPMDIVQFEDKLGNTCNSIVSHITYTMNRNTKIKCVGDSNVQEDYASIPVNYVTNYDLTNANSNTYKRITTITEDTIETTNVIALNLLVQNVLCKDSNNNEIFKVDSATHVVRIAGSWSITKDKIQSLSGGQLIVENSGQDMYRVGIGLDYENYQAGAVGKPPIQLICPSNTFIGGNDRYIPICSFMTNNTKYYLVVYVPYAQRTNPDAWSVRIHSATYYESYVAHKYTDTY